ncbi:MAG: YhcH/YjgK/YiaL family protein [Patescibacteria group bacterium]
MGIDNPTLQKVIKYLKETDLLFLKIGRTKIEGDNIFLMVQEYETRPKEEKSAEQHKKYIDIQLILSGEEIIGCGFENPNNEVIDPYVEKKIGQNMGRY